MKWLLDLWTNLSGRGFARQELMEGYLFNAVNRNQALVDQVLISQHNLLKYPVQVIRLSGYPNIPDTTIYVISENLLDANERLGCSLLENRLGQRHSN